MTREEIDLNEWERKPNVIKVLTSKEMGAWLHRRDENKAKKQQFEDAINRRKAISVISACDGKSAQIEALEKLPPAQPKPRVGHWIYDKRIENWKCSECGCSPKTIGYVGRVEFMREHFKFCNHCGAKMTDAIMGEK